MASSDLELYLESLVNMFIQSLSEIYQPISFEVDTLTSCSTDLNSFYF